jgi:DNA-binding response OmpR family regulator
MTRLVLIEDRPGIVDALRAEGVAVVPTCDDREGFACVRSASPGVVTVDLALPGQAGYRCVSALAGVTSATGTASEIPIIAVGQCDQSTPETALSARLRAFVRRDRPIRLDYLAGWPSTLGLSSREFDRFMMIVRRCGRVVMDPDRRFFLSVRTFGFLRADDATDWESGLYSDAWHATQFAIARDTTLEHRAIA